jgi:hypothetical protein
VRWAMFRKTVRVPAMQSLSSLRNDLSVPFFKFPLTLVRFAPADQIAQPEDHWIADRVYDRSPRGDPSLWSFGRCSGLPNPGSGAWSSLRL